MSILSINVPANPPNASVEILKRNDALDTINKNSKKIPNPITLILESILTPFCKPDTAEQTTVTPNTIPTKSHIREFEGIPVIFEIPPEIFMNACATLPAIPQLIENKVIASITCIHFGWYTLFPSKGEICDAIENGFFAL